MFDNLIAFLITSGISVVWLRAVDTIAHKGYVSARVSRKIIHIGTGPIFILCWLLFRETAGSRYIAAIIPLLISVQFALIGFGIIKDKASVDAMSRSGDRREILKGPLFYGIAFVVLTILFWKDSPAGMIALLMLCGGDGMADLVGNRFVSVKIPWNAKKSLVGSAAVFVFGVILSLGVLGIYSLAGESALPFKDHIMPVVVIGIVSTLVESLPLKDIDNITVPLTALLTGLILYR
jgi:phytol kinase